MILQVYKNKENPCYSEVFLLFGFLFFYTRLSTKVIVHYITWFNT